jgi:hypothetical protein
MRGETQGMILEVTVQEEETAFCGRQGPEPGGKRARKDLGCQWGL